MMLLSGARIVLPDRILEGGTLVIEADRIVAVEPGTLTAAAGAQHLDLRQHFIVPGFIDVHVHGVEGEDSLDGGGVIERLAGRLPRFGVTGFCPTSVACSPPVLRTMLDQVRAARERRPASAARVLPAHLESNFINPDYKGAQPLECLRTPPGLRRDRSARGQAARAGTQPVEGDFTGADILAEIEAARAEVGIVTVAPELEGCLDLIRELVSHGHRVSLGHSGASYEQGLAAVDAGAHHATHLFNRMPPLTHRAPGLAGAVLDRQEVSAEIVCDGVHVHPAVVRAAVAAKRPAGVMAITDGTAGSGLPRGTQTSLGGRRITVGDVARLDDGTIAGSVLTMDRAFSNLVTMMGFSLVEAAIMCSSSPAKALNLEGFGAIVPGAFADLAILDRDLNVVHTFIAGSAVWSRHA